MAPFNFAQRSSSRTAMPREDHTELKLEKLDLHAPVSVKETGLPPAAGRYAGKPPHLSGTFEPSKAFVRQLATKSEYRSGLCRLSPLDAVELPGGPNLFRLLGGQLPNDPEVWNGLEGALRVGVRCVTADPLLLASSDYTTPWGRGLARSTNRFCTTLSRAHMLDLAASS